MGGCYAHIKFEVAKEKGSFLYPYYRFALTMSNILHHFIRHPPSVRWQMKLKRIELKISKVNFHWHAWHAFDSKTAECCVKNIENNHLCNSQTAICFTESIRPPSPECSHKSEIEMEKNFENNAIDHIEADINLYAGRCCC